MLRWMRFRILRWFLNAYRFYEGETIVIAFKDEMRELDLADIREDLGDALGENVVLIGGVDKIIIAE